MIGKGVLYLKGTHQRLIHTHHRTRVIEFPAIIGSREEGYELPTSKKFVSVLYDLMRSAYQIHIVFLEEPSDNVGSERERDTAVVFGPSGDVFIGIRPEQVAE
jgi:hypothetical protein